MTDQPVDSTSSDEPGAPPPAALSTADEPTTEPGAEAPSSIAPVPTSRRPADRMQQVLTASVLLLIAASAVLLAITIANR